MWTQALKNGVSYLLEFDEENCSWSNTFSDGYQLDAGQYLLVSGQRLAGGGVLVNMNLFEIKPDETATVPLVMLTDEVCRDHERSKRVVAVGLWTRILHSCYDKGGS